MDCNEILIISLNFIISFFTFCCSAIVLVSDLLKKSSSIEYYYISNIWYVISCIISYISFFIIFLYCLRIYNFSSSVDLKIIFKNIRILNELSQNLSWIFKIYMISIAALLLINIIILLCLLHKYCNHQIFKLYLFLKNNTIERYENQHFFSGSIRDPYDSDLFSYALKAILIYIDRRFYFHFNKLPWKPKAKLFSVDYNNYFKSWDLYNIYIKQRSRFYYLKIVLNLLNNKYYRKFIMPFSPIALILYDCIFNNLLIIHVYYYLLIYVPLMLWRRITISLSTENDIVGALVWDILYKDEHCIYALPLDHKNLFDVYINNGIRTVPIPGIAELDLHVSMYIKQICKFEYESEENYYKNSENMEIHEPYNTLAINDKAKVLIWENGEEHYEDWYIIAIKKEI